jgi:hypothetical protein
MTSHYKTEKKTRFVEVLVNVTCDRCGKEIEEPKDTYAAREFTLEFLEGHYWPDCPDMYGWEVADLCDECVEELRKLLEEHGYNVVKKESE